MALSIEEMSRKNRQNDYDITKEQHWSIQKENPTKEICRNCGSIMETEFERDEEAGNDLYYIYNCTNEQCGFIASVLQ